MIKEQDMKIIRRLRENARETLTDMSKVTGIPISTIYDRLKAHDGSIIKKHTTIVDFAKLGYGTRANIALKVNKKNRADLIKLLREHSQVNSAYLVTGSYDYIIECVFKNMLELKEFNELLEDKYDIREKQTYHIIEDVKREGLLI